LIVTFMGALLGLAGVGAASVNRGRAPTHHRAHLRSRAAAALCSAGSAFARRSTKRRSAARAHLSKSE
jgi:hypothetical protein